LVCKRILPWLTEGAQPLISASRNLDGPPLGNTEITISDAVPLAAHRTAELEVKLRPSNFLLAIEVDVSQESCRRPQRTLSRSRFDALRKFAL
jgi:hypothetical protein